MFYVKDLKRQVGQIAEKTLHSQNAGWNEAFFVILLLETSVRQRKYSWHVSP